MACLPVACRNSAYLEELSASKGTEVSFHITLGVEEPLGIGPDRTKHITWADGDELLLYSAEVLGNNMATYVVRCDTSENLTYATMSSRTPHLWGDGPHVFYGVYPATAHMATMDGVTVTCHIPAEQRLTADWDNPRHFRSDLSAYGYMYSIVSVGHGMFIPMEFRHLTTSMTFSLQTSPDDPVEAVLQSVVLSSEQEDAYLAGSFTTALDPSTEQHAPVLCTDITDGSNQIRLSFDNGVQLGSTPEEAIVVHLVAIPMEQSALTLSLCFAGGLTRSINLKKDEEWITAAACKKNNFRNLVVPGTL